jgi:hypothetical protein
LTRTVQAVARARQQSDLVASLLLLPIMGFLRMRAACPAVGVAGVGFVSVLSG